MKFSINKVTLMGFIGKDPEIAATTGGLQIAKFNLATSESIKDKDTGEYKDRTDWHRCVAFGKTAEHIGKYVLKGSKVYVEGSIKNGKYKDKEGIERYTTDIMVSDFALFENKKEGGSTYVKPAEKVVETSEPFSDDIPF